MVLSDQNIYDLAGPLFFVFRVKTPVITYSFLPYVTDMNLFSYMQEALWF